MAELVNKDAIIRFLAGYEENLTGRAIEDGTVYFALKPDPSNSSNTVGSIYIDANGKRIMMSGDGTAIKDTQGDLILTKYIKAIEMDGSLGTKATLTYYKGNGDDVPLDMPTASATTAGVVTTGAQTFAGNKTFSNAVTINGASNFNYGGIEAGTSNAARVVWFAHANRKGTPVYHDAFTYNPSSGTLTVAKLAGLASKATGDGQGNNIYETYLKDLEGTEGTGSFVIKGIKGNDDNSPTTVTIPAANTSKAGLVTTGEQTFKGKKIFQNFNYSGITADNATNAERAIWFQSSTSGTPQYSTGFTYNPSTKTITVANLNGVALKATGDSQGNNIYQTYLKSGELDATVDKHKLILIKGNNDEIEIPMNFVDRSGDTMSGALTLNAGATIKTMKDANTATPFIITRSGGLSESTSIYQNDNTLFFNMENDETTAAMEFNMSATDTENSDGSRANSGAVKFQMSGGKTTVTADNFSGLVTKATGDSQGNNIYTTYLSDVDSSNDGTSFSIWGVKKNNGNSPTTITIGGATNALAGLVTTGDQTFAGVKTFAGFVYSGMSESTANSDRALWFMSSTKGTPTYNDDLVYNPSTKTLKVEKFDGTITKATGDGQGNNIYETYLKDLEGTQSTTKFTIKGIKGNDATTADIIIPAATNKIAGLITTGSQTFKGTKTFAGFRYSGIAANTALTTAQPIWFQSATSGTPVYNTDLTYTPSTKTLAATNFSGLASKATADGNGLNIRENYLKGIENTNSDKHILTLVKGNDSTSDLTLGFVLKTGDTMSGKLTLEGGALIDTDTANKPLVISRMGTDSESTNIYQNDTGLNFDITNDETTSGLYLGLIATDTESSGGANAFSKKTISFVASKAGGTVITADKFTGLSAKATADSAGNNILEKYISEIAISEHTGNSFKFKAYDGKGDDQNEIVLPVDTTGTLATLIVNGAQTLLGIKTFTDGLTVTSKEFRYTGIESATANADRVVWFADSGDKGKPVYNTNFTYNPATKTLKVENITGTISNAIKDQQGNTIYTYYLKDIDSKTGTETFQFWGVKGDSSDGTVITVPKATSTVAGLMATTDQTFAGVKTFKNNIVLKGDTSGYPQIQKEGSSTSWIKGRDTAVVRITTHTTDAMYNAITSMKTSNGDWSNGVYTSDNMYWTYTPDTNYNANNNTGYVQMILSKAGLLTVPSLLASTRATIGGAVNTNYTLYNHGTSYFADNVSMGAKLTVTGETSLSGIAIFRQDESVTSGSSAAYRNSLVLFGDTYGNDAAYIKNAGRLSYGDPGPQIIFGTSGTLSSAQKLALIFTDHDTIGTGTSLSLVSDQSDAYFIAPSIKALTRLMVGNGAHNYFATVQGPDTANATFYFPNTGGTFVTHPTRGTAVGAADKPVYIASTGVATVSNANIGNNSQPIYMQAGQLKSVPIVGTGYGGTGNTGFTKGTMIYAEEDNLISSNTAITTNGGSELTVTGSGTTGAFVKTTNNSTNTVGIYSSTNRGLYDFKKAWWIIYTRSSDDTTRVPKHLYLDDQLTVAKDITAQEDITVTKTGGLITTPNLFATENISIGTQDLTKGLNNTKTTFLGDILTVDADSNLKRIVVTDTSAVKHIEFKRAGWNYFATPSGGCFAFLPNGAATGEDNSRVVIESGGIRPGKTNTYDLGTSAKYWRNGYIQTLAVSSNATIGGTLGVTGKVTLSGALEVVGATTLKNTLSVTGVATFNSTVTVKNELTGEGNIWVKNANPYIGFMEGTTTVGYLQADGGYLYLGSTSSKSLRVDSDGNVNIPTGVLTLMANKYDDNYSGALNLSNSNIYGVNSIYTADLADGSSEGIHFYRTATTVDSIWVSSGTIYFTPNRTLGTAGTSYHVLHTGNYTNHLDSRYVFTSGDTMYGQLNIYTSATGADPGNAAIQIREVNCAGSSSTHSAAYAPRLGFHWGNRYWGQLVLFDSAFRFYDSSLSGYMPVWASAFRGGSLDSSGDSTMRLYAHHSNEVNFGGTNTSGTIYFGYRALDSKPIPTNFVFGGSTGTATITASYLAGTAASANSVNLTRSISGSSHANALSTEFTNNKASILRNRLLTYYSSAYGNGSFYMGYFLSGYDSNPYGGFFVAHYGTPYYVGITSGSFSQHQLWKAGDAVTGAVWNDYAECRESEETEPGYVLCETGKDTLIKTIERMQHFAGVSSDTWGFSQGETEKAKTNIAVAGRVLVYPYQDRDNYKPGDCVCAAPGGKVDIMTREEIINYPDRIVGTVSCVPQYETWGGGNDRDPVQVNGRIWIKVR